MHITTKELSYISDSMNNEDLLAKLCVQGAVECRDQQLGQIMARMAEVRFGNCTRLQNKLLEKAGITH